MEDQKVNKSNAGIQNELAKSIGKEIEAVAPDKTNLLENEVEKKNIFLKERSKDIVFLDQDSRKKAKIFAILLNIKETYPQLSMNDFVNNYFSQNGNASNNLIGLVGQTAKDVERYYNKSENKNNLETDLSKLKSKRGIMLRALKAVGITYNQSPDLETLAEDFYNIIINKGQVNNFDFGGLVDTIGNVTNNISEVGKSVGQVVGAVNQVQNAVKGNTNINYNPPTQSPQTIQTKFIQEEKKKTDLTPFILGGGVLISVILLILLFRK